MRSGLNTQESGLFELRNAKLSRGAAAKALGQSDEGPWATERKPSLRLHLPSPPFPNPIPPGR
eukprot:3705571-Pyramimonas_sp.AAC.1